MRAAREIEDREAHRVESALHTVFGPHRVNASREFFQIDPEQVLAILAVLPGRDVTPRLPGQDTDAQDQDQAVVNEYRKRQARTNEQEFMDSLNENGAVVYRRILDLGNHGGMWVNWTRTGFSLSVITEGASVPVCYGYPPSSSNQRLYTAFVPIASKSNVPQEVAEALREAALETGLVQSRRERHRAFLQDGSAYGRIPSGRPDRLVDEHGVPDTGVRGNKRRGSTARDRRLRMFSGAERNTRSNTHLQGT